MKVLKFGSVALRDERAAENMERIIKEEGEGCLVVKPTLDDADDDMRACTLAASKDASQLVIYTDADGFTTADPRIINTTYVIPAITYLEASELCNFGVRIINPRALYQVRSKGIPVRIKSIFKPEAEGTLITASCSHERSITGISSIEDTPLITLSGNSMAGLVGIDKRIFSALAREGISIFMVSQGSSETGITLGVASSVADRAKALIDEEFAAEIALGSIDPVSVRRGLSTIGVVGEGMKNRFGVLGKLCSVLGRNGINVTAIAQGADESNVSIVVDSAFLRKSLNVIHDSFFLSEYRELNLFICGTGTVGSSLISQIASQREILRKERHLSLNVVGIARSRKGVFSREGVDITDPRAAAEKGIDITPAAIRDNVIGMNIFNSVFVDCTASAEIAGLYRSFLQKGISVVAANKIAASGDYETYRSLKQTARDMGVRYLFETNVGAGLPIIGTIGNLVDSGDRIQKIEAVLSGTLNFVFNALSEEIPFSKAVRMAMDAGFAEPDPRIDLSGRDVMRKIVILSREAGYKVSLEDVRSTPFIPAELFDCSLDEFFRRLPSLDASFEERRKVLAAAGRKWRYVATMENGDLTAGLQEVDSTHPFYPLEGSNNIVLLTSERYHSHPMMIRGYGAGADVTAAGVFADIMSIANI